MLPVVLLFFSSIVWGLSWWPLKHIAAQGLSGLALNLVAYGSISLLALPVLIVQFSRWRAHMASIAAIALLGGVANLAFTLSIIDGDVIRVMALFYLLPVWGIAGGRIFLGEQLTPARIAAVIFAVTGGFFLLGGVRMLEQPPDINDALAVLSGIALAANNLVFRATPAVPVQSKIAVMFVGCALLSTGLLIAHVQPWPQIDADVWSLGIAFGVVVVLLGTSCTQWAVTRMETGRSAVIMVMELVTAVLSASVIDGSHLSSVEWLGAMMILLAALLEARSAQP